MLEPDNPTETPAAASPEPSSATAERPARPAPAKKAAAKKAPAKKAPAKKAAANKAPAKKAAANKAPAKRAPAKKARPDAVTTPATEPAAADRAAPESSDAAAVTSGTAPDARDGAAPAGAPRKRAPRKARATAVEPATDGPAPGATAKPADAPEPAAGDAARSTRRRSARRAAPAPSPPPAASGADEPATSTPADPSLPTAAPGVLFVAPSDAPEPVRTRRRATRAASPPPAAPVEAVDAAAEVIDEVVEEPEEVREAAAEEATGARRRRRRGRRGRGRRDSDETPVDEPVTDAAEQVGSDPTIESADEEIDDEDAEPDEATESGATTPARRRRRRRRRTADEADDAPSGSDDDPPDTVVHVRQTRARDRAEPAGDGVRGVRGSTRLEAKRQRRREGRDTGRRRGAPILTEAEFLARRESVDRTMAVRQLGDRTQIAVLEDDILVEHYVTRASATSYVGNVYLGRVQNVLPSMEAAFVDIGKGRNGVLYAGEVNWDAAGLDGKSRAIENALKSGDTVLVQVTKDPVGHKGARLTSQVSLPGRYLVYVPGGGMTGISRKLPDTERHRLKSILKQVVPEDAGVIIRTAAEGASEEELTRDVDRLKGQWASIEQKAAQPKSAPALVNGEPDLAIRVVRDVFNEDFARLVVQGDAAWETVAGYVSEVAPDLQDRLSRYSGDGDLFHELRVDEQLTKALDRKVFLPSGGSLVIDRTEAMTVVDVNTGKFVGSGGNLEQTVTRNNLEAAEEIVRQLRLRDIGGIIVIDFIDMVLESNRDLVLRRLTECLGRDRTKHQVAEVTSLGLVQMTRKRVGEGLLEAFSETCPTCGGRGLLIHAEPVDQRRAEDAPADGAAATRGGKRKRATSREEPAAPPTSDEQRKAAADAMAAIAGTRGTEDSDIEPLAAAGERSADTDRGEDPAQLPDVPEAVLIDVELADPGSAGDIVDGLESALDFEPAPASGPAPDTEPAPITEPAPLATTAAEPDGESRRPASRRRGRRSASRPAGPPVPVA